MELGSVVRFKISNVPWQITSINESVETVDLITFSGDYYIDGGNRTSLTIHKLKDIPVALLSTFKERSI
ncbi:MAG: hypothetical protein WC679_00665 [Bacteroidales bacterium]|jgi:hypothetical protein